MDNFFVKSMLLIFVFSASLGGMSPNDTGEPVDYLSKLLADFGFISDKKDSFSDEKANELSNIERCDNATSSGTSASVQTQQPVVSFSKVFFSPGIMPFLVQFICQEKKAIRVAMYRFTHYDAAQALVEKKNQLVEKITSSDQAPVSLCVNQD